MNALYDLVLYPLVSIIEFVFSLSSHIFKKSPGVCVLCVSVAVTLLSLPLYIVAEKWQDVQRAIEKKLKGDIAHIKKSFSGDEQYMLLSTLYRQNHYHPIMALRSSFSLLIMIPFFMAAYSYLSHLEALQSKSFLFIRDMGFPDACFSIGSFGINVLPVLMTLINCISSAIYSRGHDTKEKVQLYACALVFLVLLYTSSAGLVLYWTMNNFLSLVKNVFYKLKNPKKVLYFLSCMAALFIDIFLLFVHRGNLAKRLFMTGFVSLLFFLPLYLAFIKYLTKRFLLLLQNKKTRHTLFLLCVCSTGLLLGQVLPLGVINSSVVEFFDIDSLGVPLVFVDMTFLKCVGLFVLWPCGVYFLFGEKVQSVFCFLAMGLLLCVLLNAFLFVGSYGTLSRLMTFSDNIAGATKKTSIILSLLAGGACFVLLLFLAKIKAQKTLTAIFCTILLCFISMTFCYRFNITKQSNFFAKQANTQNTQDDFAPVLHFSKTGKNVLLLMLDKAESAYFSQVLEQAPDVKMSLQGFTFFPNTVSYGGHTIFGAPPIFGGYEYTPQQINKRQDSLLVTKHNEALLMLPRVFTEQLGFKSTACDSSWAGYTWVADMSIFEPYKDITALSLERTYSDRWLKENPDKVEPNILSNTIKRNLLYVCVFRCLCPAFRELFYDEGRWWNTKNVTGDIQEFLDYYSALCYMPQITDFSATGDTFFSITNDTTHQKMQLQAPEYEVARVVTNLGEGKYKNTQDFGVNVAAFKKVAIFFDFLRQNNCYDNTRIVIVADHGIGRFDLKDSNFDTKVLDYPKDHFHPVLLLKDFNETGDIKQDDTFMTTADVPTLLLRGLVENPINPFTKNPIFCDTKQKQGAVVTTNKNWTPGQQGLYKFKINSDQWFRVHDYFDNSKWQKIDKE